MKYVLGLTGGSGAGKSLAASFFEKKGAHIIDADKISRLISEKGGEAFCEIKKAFPEAFLEDELQRKLLGKIVFNDNEKLNLLNEITHKHIVKKIKDEIENSDGFIVLDAPLLYEASCDKMCDTVLFIDSPIDLRIKRIMKRDALSFDDAKTRLESRDLDKIKKLSPFIIENNGNEDEFYESLYEFLRKENLII